MTVAAKFLEEKKRCKKSKPKQDHKKNPSSILASFCKSRKQHSVPEMEKKILLCFIVKCFTAS